MINHFIPVFSVMRNRNRFKLLSAIFFIVAFMPQVPSEDQSPDQLETQFLEAINETDEKKLRALVTEYRYRTYAFVIGLLDDGLRYELAGDSENARNCMEQAQRLDKMYSNVFNEDCLRKRIDLYQGWSKVEKTKKLKSDSLRASGLEAYEKTDFPEALRLWSASLELYRDIGDQRGEGSVLFRIPRRLPTLPEARMDNSHLVQDTPTPL